MHIGGASLVVTLIIIMDIINHTFLKKTTAHMWNSVKQSYHNIDDIQSLDILL